MKRQSGRPKRVQSYSLIFFPALKQPGNRIKMTALVRFGLRVEANQIAHSKATFNKNLTSFFGLVKVCLSRPFMCLDFFFF